MGIFSLDIYYDRVNYEISYTIKDDIVVIVNMIGSRENFYKELKAYLKSGFD